MTRRQMLEWCGGVAAATRSGVALAPAASTNQPEDVRLGVCSYSCREFQRKLAISMMKKLGVRYASVKDFHLHYDVTPEDAKKAKDEFKKAGLTIVSGGTVPLQKEDPAVLRRYFEYARLCGMPEMVVAPTAKTMPMVEKLVQEFDIKVAVHNHGPEDKHFPTPQSVLEMVKDMDPRVGLCIDAGHTMRTGVDVLESIAQAGPRLLEMHIKDLSSATEKESQCDVGEGIMPVVAIFKQLKKMGYKGYVNLEYEIHGEDPLPGMLHSMGYMRGVLAGMAG